MPKITIDRDIFVATCTTEEICIWIRDDNVLWAQLSNVVLSANMQKEYFARRKRYREEDAKWMANRIRNITITEKCDETYSITRSKWNERTENSHTNRIFPFSHKLLHCIFWHCLDCAHAEIFGNFLLERFQQYYSAMHQPDWSGRVSSIIADYWTFCMQMYAYDCDEMNIHNIQLLIV